MGNGPSEDDDEEEMATKALVFMVNMVNDHFKLPFAHFFTNNLTGKGIV